MFLYTSCARTCTHAFRPANLRTCSCLTCFCTRHVDMLLGWTVLQCTGTNEPNRTKDRIRVEVIIHLHAVPKLIPRGHRPLPSCHHLVYEAFIHWTQSPSCTDTFAPQELLKKIIFYVYILHLRRFLLRATKMIHITFPHTVKESFLFAFQDKS